jgi:hypothetical protein
MNGCKKLRETVERLKGRVTDDESDHETAIEGLKGHVCEGHLSVWDASLRPVVHGQRI